MARPRSEDKRNAILQAAIAEFAARGVWHTPTSAISKAAGVAEGTLFTYFASKDELVNALYRQLKGELAERMLAGHPAGEGVATVKAGFGHVFKTYVHWGAANPARFKVMTQLKHSDRVTAESRAAGMAAFGPLGDAAQQAIAQGVLRPLPFDFLCALLGGMAEATMGFVATAKPGDPDHAEAAFEVFWRGIVMPAGSGA
ncbi:TetR/AcrR family transcriptional regulator [Ideonella azotifigens]|nr:TetR/AcrR family transcriptional regulator [Ideonella azotifigens]MCD2340401.1 TetR/AcrR family transcriptional regulator [Ideonella azotifigens]